MILRGQFMSFESLKPFRKLKDELRRLSGSDESYRCTIRRFGIEHADQIGDDFQRVRVEAALQQALNQARWDMGEERPAEADKAKAHKFSPFTWQEQFEEMQKHLLWLTGDHSRFFGILKRYGFENISDIRSRQESAAAYKEMIVERNRIQMDRGFGQIDMELKDALKAAERKLGTILYHDILGRDFGCTDVKEVIHLESGQLTRLLARLRDESMRIDLQQV